jgi:signal transduction histidine kinase
MTSAVTWLAGRLGGSGIRRRTVRVRLAGVYGSLFLVSGAALLAITYLLVAGWPDLPATTLLGSPAPSHAPGVGWALVNTSSGAITQLEPVGAPALERAAELHDLLIRSGIALALMAVVSVWLGWLVAGRVLRPLRAITATTNEISEDNLHQRLGLEGPDDEVKDLADTIDGLLGRLEGAFDAQRNFVANASHELRTPLTLSQALLQMSLRDPDTTAESFRATCKDVYAAGQHQERLIDSLLVLARSQRGLDHRELIDLAALVAESAAGYQSAAAAKGVRLEICADHPTPITGDRSLVERLVTNLLENAIRHNTIDGSAHLSVGQHNGEAILQVSNTGPLVARANVARLLEPFQRATNKRTADDEGLGLGLSIVAAVAHAHDATLTASAQPKGGLDIVVRFPRRGAQTGSDPNRDGAHHATGAAAAISHRPAPSTVS